ncbi:Hypothetical protein R9X50_00350200 [Acrodontium crateriforme]|uniref:Uncharacterized protein n=1 Tax=Acrodontium crateriforme TaxID=150365 RepID=A0AAQ3M2N0_9PEZI|nr:Hypothetical protein R9X50_00350200 [Acrodontium crateriforme]
MPFLTSATAFVGLLSIAGTVVAAPAPMAAQLPEDQIIRTILKRSEDGASPTDSIIFTEVGDKRSIPEDQIIRTILKRSEDGASPTDSIIFTEVGDKRSADPVDSIILVRVGKGAGSAYAEDIAAANPAEVLGTAV